MFVFGFGNNDIRYTDGESTSCGELITESLDVIEYTGSNGCSVFFDTIIKDFTQAFSHLCRLVSDPSLSFQWYILNMEVKKMPS